MDVEIEIIRVPSALILENRTYRVVTIDTSDKYVLRFGVQHDISEEFHELEALVREERARTFGIRYESPDHIEYKNGLVTEALGTLDTRRGFVTKSKLGIILL